MKTWYYSTDGDSKNGPITEAEIRDLLTEQKISKNTMLWTHGMENWVPLAQVDDFSEQQPPELSPPPIQKTAPPPLRTIPAGLRGWLLFLGISTLCTGVLSCLTFFGIASGIPLIIAGTALLGARTALDEPVEMDRFLEKIRTATIGLSIIYIFGSLIVLLMLLLIIPLFGAALAAHGTQFMQLIQP